MPTQLPGSFESTWHHATLGVVSDVLVARSDMLSSWGDPSYPSVVRISEPPPYVLDLGERQTGVYGLPTARQARDLTEASRGVGSLTWGRIAVQALSDAIAAPDDAARRREVVQLAAVALAWIEDIDRRRRARPAGLEARSAQEIVP